MILSFGRNGIDTTKLVIQEYSSSFLIEVTEELISTIIITYVEKM